MVVEPEDVLEQEMTVCVVGALASPSQVIGEDGGEEIAGR
jgi:hypothetical protein